MHSSNCKEPDFKFKTKLAGTWINLVTTKRFGSSCMGRDVRRGIQKHEVTKTEL